MGPLATNSFNEPPVWLWNGSSVVAANVQEQSWEPAGVHIT